jgi:hypothetical protein
MLLENIRSNQQMTNEGTPCVYKKNLNFSIFLKLVVCILLRVLGQVQGFRLTQHWFEYFIH